jgi:hypothetical protein
MLPLAAGRDHTFWTSDISWSVVGFLVSFVSRSDGTSDFHKAVLTPPFGAGPICAAASELET